MDLKQSPAHTSHWLPVTSWFYPHNSPPLFRVGGVFSYSSSSLSLHSTRPFLSLSLTPSHTRTRTHTVCFICPFQGPQQLTWPLLFRRREERGKEGARKQQNKITLRQPCNHTHTHTHTNINTMHICSSKSLLINTSHARSFGWYIMLHYVTVKVCI